MKSLIVEDEITSRFVLQTALSRIGDSYVAVSGEEAVSAFKAALETSSPFTLVCMDIRLPGIDGIEAIRQIRAAETGSGDRRRARAKILMTTSVDPRDIVSDSYKDLCDGYLVKPIHQAQLLETLIKIRGCV